MIRRIRIKLIVAGLALTTGSVLALDWERLDDSVIRLVVPMDQGMATGSAFAINDQGYYVTNHHVIKPAVQGGELMAVESVSPAKKLHAASVVWYSQEKDLAIVQVPDWKRPPLKLAEASQVKKNQTVITIGFPGASDFNNQNAGFTEPKIKRGVISARQSFPFQAGSNPVEVFEHDATVNSGNSGGPLVDSCGRVVGVNVAKATSKIGVGALLTGIQQGVIPVNIQEGTFFSIRVSELTNILSREGIDFESDTSPCEASNASISTGVIRLLGGILLILAIAYMRLRCNASSSPIDAGYISRLIREKLNGGSMKQRSNPVADKKLRRGSDGQIIEAEAQQASPKSVARLRPLQNHWPQISLAAGKTCTLGRDPNQADTVIEHDDISRRHAEFRVNHEDTVQVRDLNSTNGTFLDHRRVENDWMTIQPGQRLILSGEDIVYTLDDEG